MNIPRYKKRPLFLRLLFWSLPVLFVLLIAGFIFVRIWFLAYLKSDAFRELIGGITSNQIKAKGEYQQFSYNDGEIFSNGYSAHGLPEAAFSDLRADEIRAKINLAGLWNHAWEIDQIDIQNFQVSFRNTAGSFPAAEPGQAPEESHGVPSTPGFGWLPDHTDLRKVIIHQTNLQWGQDTPQRGAISNAEAIITPDGEAWKIYCDSGTISQQGQPDLTIDQADLRYQRPTLFITDAALRYSSDSSIDLSGEVNPESGFDVRAKLNGIPITPLLSTDWRAKLKGNLSGNVKIRGDLPMTTGPRVEGKLTLAQGELEALPVLDQIATFTSTERFRQLSLTKASADFTRTDEKLTVTNFIAESEGLICMKGGFVVENGLIDGNFDVGITPASLEWLPPTLQNKVFTASHDGYVWTTMHLTGPVNHPVDDLTKRLITAAVDTGVDTIKGVIQQIPGSDSIPDESKKLIDGASGFLSPLLNK